MSDTPNENRETRKFEADVDELLKLVVGSLYSHKEVFLRELVSNAYDALEKLRFRAVAEPDLLSHEPTLEIRIIPDADAGTLTIEDTGIGMTHDELVENLGTIARSGSRAFLDKTRGQEGPDMSLIGQFGVGFYSAYLVADRVTVTSLAAGQREAFTWQSDAKGAYTLEPARRVERGTSVVLHLKDSEKGLLDEWQLRELIRRYSDYIAQPIRLRVARTKKEGDETKTEHEWELVNRATALWQRSPSDVTKDQYDELYKHITHDFEAPLAHSHFKIEGTQLFSGIVFVPKSAPFDLMNMQRKKGIRLYVKRVFIMEDCEEFLPPYLRFVRGVVDSDDLPLNVSRELLQDSSIVRTIRKQVTKKTLDRLEEMSKGEKADYETFFATFGAVLKEGIAIDFENKDRIVELSRFRSTHGPGMTSLEDYVGRMKEGQEQIYFALGESIAQVEHSPHLEGLRKQGYEVLLMTDPVDEWVVDSLGEYKGKKFVSALRADLKLGADDASKPATDLGPLAGKIRTVLGDRVSDVRSSTRLTDSPACLVLPEGAHHAPVEKLLRAVGRETPKAKRIFEVNAEHPFVKSLQTLVDRNADLPAVGEWIETLYDQAVLSEGGKLEDPARFARRLTVLLEHASSRLVDAGSQASSGAA